MQWQGFPIFCITVKIRNKNYAYHSKKQFIYDYKGGNHVNWIPVLTVVVGVMSSEE